MTNIDSLPHALTDTDQFKKAVGGRALAMFCDYDGVMTPIVSRPEDAVISDAMREVVRRLAAVCRFCVVSGRDRVVVQQLMGIDDLVVAGSHGFDIWSPSAGTIELNKGAEYAELLVEVKDRLQRELGDLDGVLIEPKRSSVAVHYRLVDQAHHARVADTVEQILADNPDDLKVTPGKMVFELQPQIDWDKGKAVDYLIDALGLDESEFIPVYLGDDITDEHAFAALHDRGIGIFVGRSDDPEIGGRETAADFRLSSVDEVQQFFNRLAIRLAGHPSTGE